MSPEDYEQLTSQIVAGICESASALSAYRPTAGRTSKVRGKSGYSHQIDVCLETASAIYLVECKRWKDPIGIQEVMVLASRGNDVAAFCNKKVHAIIASTKGASKNAVKLAKLFRIKIEIVQSPHEFGMQIGAYISVGILAAAVVTDTCEADVRKSSRAG